MESNIEKEKINSYLKGTEDMVRLCIIAQKYIRMGDFVQGREHLESITNTANYLKQKIEEET